MSTLRSSAASGSPLISFSRAVTLALVSLSLSFMASASRPFLAAVFLGHFLHLLLDGRELGLQLLDGGLLGGEVAGDDERGRDQSV